AESSRARALLEMLSHAQVNFRQGLDSALTEQEKHLKQRLTAKSNYRLRLITGEHTDQQVSTLDSEIEQIVTQYGEIEGEIRTASPGYAALNQPQPLTVREIQKLLDPDTALLEYSLGEERSHLWIVSADSLHVRDLPGRAEIERVARDFYQSLTERTRGVNADPQVKVSNSAKADALSQRLAARLNQMILSPA